MKNVVVCPDRETAGQRAAQAVAAAVRAAIDARGRARAIFASAPSQSRMLAALADQEGIDWSALDGFHMDEYLGIDMNHPQAFGRWLEQNLPAGAVKTLERIRTDGDIEPEIVRYTQILRRAPIDISCVGVGVNGHLAFNEPHVAKIDDEAWMRKVRLDDASRRQQVDDGLFATLDAVPVSALTLTIPALLSARSVVCVVDGARKAEAVAAALLGPVSSALPASALRNHGNVTWFLDPAAAEHLPARLVRQEA